MNYRSCHGCTLNVGEISWIARWFYLSLWMREIRSRMEMIPCQMSQANGSRRRRPRDVSSEDPPVAAFAKDNQKPRYHGGLVVSLADFQERTCLSGETLQQVSLSCLSSSKICRLLFLPLARIPMPYVTHMWRPRPVMRLWVGFRQEALNAQKKSQNSRKAEISEVRSPDQK